MQPRTRKNMDRQMVLFKISLEELCLKRRGFVKSADNSPSSRILKAKRIPSSMRVSIFSIGEPLSTGGL